MGLTQIKRQQNRPSMGIRVGMLPNRRNFYATCTLLGKGKQYRESMNAG